VQRHRYRIIVSGRLGKFTREIFEDLCVEHDGPNTGLTGELDQAALYGVLNRFAAFGLELVALSRLDDEPAEIGPARDVPPTEAAVTRSISREASSSW
jgi:hypothetical protein